MSSGYNAWSSSMEEWNKWRRRADKNLKKGPGDPFCPLHPNYKIPCRKCIERLKEKENSWDEIA